MHTLPDMSPRVLNCGVPVHIREQTKAESVVVVVWWVGEAVHYDAVVLSMVHLAHPTVQLVVSDRRPKGWLLILHRLGGVGTLTQFHIKT